MSTLEHLLVDYLKKKILYHFYEKDKNLLKNKLLFFS